MRSVGVQLTFNLQGDTVSLHIFLYCMIHTMATLENWKHPDWFHQLAFAFLSCEVLVVLLKARHCLQGMKENEGGVLEEW